MPFKNFCLNRIQNGLLLAIIHFQMADIWLTVLDGQTFTLERNVRFQLRMHLGKFRLDQIQNGRL